MTQDPDFNQDDAFNTRGVEASAFGPDEAAVDDDAKTQSTAPKKPLPFLKILGGAVGLFVLFIAAVVIFGPKADDDASYDQVRGQGAVVQGFETPEGANPYETPEAPQQLASAVEVASVPTQTEDPFASIGIAPTVDSPASVPTPSQIAPAVVEEPAPEPTQVVATPAPVTPALPAATPAAARDDIAVLAGQVESLRGDVERLRGELVAQRRSGTSASAAPRAQARVARAVTSPPAPAAPARVEGMTLKAIVEQNAWLQTSNGESVMVSPGDAVPGGGAVKSIDPDSGIVHLTDGRVIR